MMDDNTWIFRRGNRVCQQLIVYDRHVEDRKFFNLVISVSYGKGNPD